VWDAEKSAPFRHPPRMARMCLNDHSDRGLGWVNPMAIEDRTQSTHREIFTIGHSNHPIEKFLCLLTQHAISVLIDARSHPYSRYVPHFDRELLESSVESHGIRYLYMGDELGGRPPEAEYYDAEGRVLYYRVAESERFKGGISRLLKGSLEFRIAVLCSEEDPTSCHRRLLVSKVLTENGISVQHIRGTGALQPEAEIDSAAATPQLEMFEMSNQDRLSEWKSIQSVLRRDRQEISSRR
jgi:hypothetical protein